MEAHKSETEIFKLRPRVQQCCRDSVGAACDEKEEGKKSHRMQTNSFKNESECYSTVGHKISLD